jgi:hypothetical protein
MWIGPSTMEDYIEGRVHKNWRWNYNTGGGQLLDWIGHHCDIAHWGMDCDKGGGPVEIEGSGEFPAKTAMWNTATKYRAEAKYDSGVKMIIAGGHGDIRGGLPKSCAASDLPCAGLIRDLKSRGLLEDTLVVWSGEFGRTPWSQDLSRTAPIEKHGREHQPESFCAWMAGGGVRGGLMHGETDEFGFRPVSGKVHLHDLHATILHLLGLDHERLTWRHLGRDFRLTDVYGEVVREILA